MPTPEDIAELIAAWKQRLSHDEGIWLLRKYGGIGAWYHQLATVPQVARAIASELGRDPAFSGEVEFLQEFLDLLDEPPAVRRERLSDLELDGPTDWLDAVASCDLTDDFRLRFEAWIGRAREVEHGKVSTDPFAVGSAVEHATFGHGVVRGRHEDTITVAFASGEKRVLARFLQPAAKPTRITAE